MASNTMQEKLNILRSVAVNMNFCAALYNNFFKFLILVVVLSIISTVFPLVTLEKDQIMYLSSTVVQSVSALYAMSLAGYSVYKSELNHTVETSDDPEGYSQVVSDLTQEYTKKIKKISVLTFITVLSGIIQIILGDKTFFLCKYIDDFLLNLSIYLFVFVVIEIILFVTETVNPNLISLYGDLGQKSMQKDMVDSGCKDSDNDVEIGGEKKDNYEKFLKEYTLIESIILKTTDELLDKYPTKTPIRTMKQRIEYLKRFRDDLRDVLRKLDEYITYRNYLSVGTKGVNVPAEKIRVLSTLKKELIARLSVSDMIEITLHEHIEFNDFVEKIKSLKTKITKVFSASYLGHYKTIFRVRFEKKYNSPQECYESLKEDPYFQDKIECVKVVESPFKYPPDDVEFKSDC